MQLNERLHACICVFERLASYSLQRQLSVFLRYKALMKNVLHTFLTCMHAQEGGRQKTPAYRLSSLKPGHAIKGPSILIEDNSTIVIEPGCLAHITSSGDVRIDVESSGSSRGLRADECDPIQLAIFSHRCARRCACIISC